MEANYRLNLLARAEKDGKPVHEGLNLPCKRNKDDHSHMIGLMPKGAKRQVCDLCGLMGYGKGYVPNPDPMALIAACQKQFWMVIFVTKAHVMIHQCEGVGSDNATALADAMVQATKTLEPDNWAECANCCGLGGFKEMPSGGPMGENPFPDEVCVDCAGTSIKEERDGN